ncbi:hypothetical protein C2L96_25860 [Bacillus cereus]|uniref:hypothetical protein n=1 Tax=Bacillus cereus group sp. Bc191 TaxID=3018113 RepID=UPI000CCBF4B3|nr:hypothetical protein [Bacillus cereus group sp. Bc191]MDA2288428.1 hypothetical protein [Bacillus cereus group sp. Bc191]PNU09080.1 hypothetical protein C2L96_25860 [Bacillus cereus]
MKQETKKKSPRQLHTRLPDDVFAFYEGEAKEEGFDDATPYIRTLLNRYAREQIKQKQLNINIQK